MINLDDQKRSNHERSKDEPDTQIKRCVIQVHVPDPLYSFNIRLVFLSYKAVTLLGWETN
jgi:hypothetical protein